MKTRTTIAIEKLLTFPLFAFLILLGGTLTSCSIKQTPEPTRPPQSHAFKNHQSTSLGRLLNKQASQHPGQSGFQIIRHGHDAFVNRIAATQMAEKSLDLQYYLWHEDATGRLLSYSLLKAADRGVKVRILLDDMGLQGRDKNISALNAHPNIEIRIFNPFASRKMHALDFLTDFKRVNHRMHNKSFIADNALAIIGGRNIGNHYFKASKKSNFRDLDVVAAGPVVREISGVFDYFWNGSWSAPISSLTSFHQTPKDLAKHQKRLIQKIPRDRFYYELTEDTADLQSHLKPLSHRFSWATGHYVWNDPEQLKLPVEQQSGTIIRKLKARTNKLQKEFTIESPYFIPMDQGVATLKQLVDKNVRVKILTNSQDTNDVLPAQAGYMNYRKQLLEAGVQMYELRSDARFNLGATEQTPPKSAKTGLHTKAFVFDQKAVFIGSFNLDPRSSYINTEGGLYIESPSLARETLQYMSEATSLKNCYRLSLDQNGDILWETEDNGQKVIYKKEPHVSLWTRIKMRMIRSLPIEEQL